MSTRAIKRFLGRPTRGGWLSMLNCAIVAAALALYSTRLVSDFSILGAIVVASALVLSLPIGVLYLPIIEPCGSPSDVIVGCLLIGLNSFIWGYGVSGLRTFIFGYKARRRARR